MSKTAPPLRRLVIALRARKERTMPLKTYTGSCHCGAVRFEAVIDFTRGATKCNCSICAKARSWFVIVPGDRARLISGADAQTEYQWVPPGHARANLHYRFCKTCGIRTLGHGDDDSTGKPFYFVNVAALDGVDPDVLAGAPTRYVNGRLGQYDQAPRDIRAL